MNSKSAMVIVAYCLFYLLVEIEGSFIKPNNVPRVGRSNEEINPFDQGSMGYVIKTNKNIPRMGRRNYDSESRYDIPKFYQLTTENLNSYAEDRQGSDADQNMDAYYAKQMMENMKR